MSTFKTCRRRQVFRKKENWTNESEQSVREDSKVRSPSQIPVSHETQKNLMVPVSDDASSVLKIDLDFEFPRKNRNEVGIENRNENSTTFRPDLFLPFTKRVIGFMEETIYLPEKNFGSRKKSSEKCLTVKMICCNFSRVRRNKFVFYRFYRLQRFLSRKVVETSSRFNNKAFMKRTIKVEHKRTIKVEYKRTRKVYFLLTDVPRQNFNV